MKTTRLAVRSIIHLFHAMGSENETSDEWRYNGDMYAEAASYQNDWGVKDKANDCPLAVERWSEAVFQLRQCPFSPANVLQFRLVSQRGKSTCSWVLKMWLVHDEIGMYHYREVQERRRRHLTPKKPRCHGWIPISPLTESYGGGRTPEGVTLLEILLASWPQHAQLWHKSFLKMWSVHNDRYIPFLWS